jgi:hypothetical protein
MFDQEFERFDSRAWKEAKSKLTRKKDPVREDLVYLMELGGGGGGGGGG